MNPDWEDQDDPLLDSALEEILNGSSPPDLKESILAELDRLKSNDRSKSKISRKQTKHAQHYKARQVNPWSGILVVAFALSVLLLTLTWLTGNSPFDSQPTKIADNTPSVEPSAIDEDIAKSDTADDVPPADSEVVLVDESTTNESEVAFATNDETPEKVNSIESEPTLINEATEAPNLQQRPKMSFQIASDYPSEEPIPNDQIVAAIDAALRTEWKNADIRPAKPMESEAFVKLTYAKLLGRLPTAQEANTGLSRDELIDSLLATAECSEHLANQLAEPFGRNGPSVGSLSSAIQSNMRFDQMIESQFASANCSPTRFGSVLLGNSYACGSCHHEKELSIEADDAFRLAIQAADLKRLNPEFVTAIANSDQLSRNLANRLWAHFFGFGLQPRFHHDRNEAPESHNEIQTLLAQQFVAHGKDLKSLVKWISSTEAFGLSSESPKGRIVDQPSMMSFAYFSRRYSTETIKDPIPRVLNRVAKAFKPQTSQTDGSGILANRLTSSLTNEDKKAKDKKKKVANNQLDELIVQMNPDADWLLQKIHDTHLETIVRPDMPREKKIEHVYFMALGRKPFPKELENSKKVLNSFLNEVDGLRSIWWTLAHSPAAN